MSSVTARFMKSMRLAAGLAGGSKAYTGPSYADIDITRRCNMKCLGCLYHSATFRGPRVQEAAGIPDIPFELVERLCAELPALGTREVVLIGEGEPLLHPRIFDIITAFKRAGCTVQLFTNGTLLDPHNAERMLASGLDTVKVSLWGSTPEEHLLYHPGSGERNFHATMNGIKTLAALRSGLGKTHPTVILTQPLGRYNYRSIRTRIELAAGLGCDGVRFAPFIPWQGEFASAGLTPDAIAFIEGEMKAVRERAESLSLVHNIDETLLRLKLGEHVWRRLPCYVGWFYTRVKVDGTVLSCDLGQIPLGNLHRGTFREIWNGAPYRSFRARAREPQTLTSLNPGCTCDWCCYAKDNYRMHQFAGRVPGLGRKIRRPEATIASPSGARPEGSSPDSP